MSTSNETEKRDKPKVLELSIRATNGAIWDTEKFDSKDKVEHVRDRAVKHFVKKEEMSEGEYEIALLHDGVAQPPLDPAERLEDVGVHDHSHLVLVPKEPQVDG